MNFLAVRAVLELIQHEIASYRQPYLNELEPAPGSVPGV